MSNPATPAGGHRLHRRFGYEVVNGASTPLEAEQAAIRRMRELRGEGAISQAVADRLHADGTEPPGDVAWYAATIRRILKRPAAQPA